MKSFYSVLYVKPEPASDDNISVGLFLNTDRKPVFDFSENKLKIAAGLIGSDATESLERMLRNIKKKAASVSEDVNQTEAFDVEPFTESYFNYLNRYSNSLLRYSNPSDNKGDFHRSDFDELFRLLIDKNYHKEGEYRETFKDSVKRKIKASIVREKMDVFYKVPKASVKTMYRDHEVDYIGYNGSIISGNSIDMKGDPYHLENKLYLLRVLADGLKVLADKMNLRGSGKHIVFYNDPEGVKNEDLLHDALNDDTSPLRFKHWEEFEEEENWIASSNIKKFSELITSSV